MPGVTVVSELTPREGRRDLGRIARELGATYLVSGGAQLAGDQLRINLRLVRPDGAVVAGRSAEGPRTDLFRLQRGLAVQIAEFVRGQGLSAAERARLARRPTTSLSAFDAYSRGRALLERPDVPGNLDRAISEFQKAADLDPSFAPARAALSEAAWTQYQVTSDPAWAARASAVALAARDVDPDSPEVRYALALVLQGTGQQERALTELDAAIELQPTSDEAYRLRGEILADRGQWDTALASFHKAIEVRPNYWGNYRSLGLALVDAGRFDEARDAFTHIVQLLPDNAWGYQLLGTAYQQQGQRAQARAEYEESVKRGGTPATFSNLGAIYYDEGRYEDALQLFRQAAALMPRSAAMARNVGDTLQRLGRQTEAREAFGQAALLAEQDVRINPRDAHAQAALAVYLAKQGRADEAEEHLAAAAAAGTPDAAVWYRRAVVHALAGRPQVALDELSRAMAAGYSVELVKADDDLASLRSLPEFGRLTAAHPSERRLQ